MTPEDATAMLEILRQMDHDLMYLFFALLLNAYYQSRR